MARPNTRKPFQPWGLSRSRNTRSVRLTKRPNQDTVKALPKLVHFLCGGKWKASLNPAPLPARFTSSAHHTLSEQPSWTKNFFFLLLFLPTVWVRHFTHIDNILSSHMGSRPSKSLARYSFALWGCVHLLPRSPRVFQLLSVGLLSFLTSTTAASLLSVAGPSGPHGGTLLDYPLSKRTEEDHKTPQLLGWKPNTSWALWDQSAQESHGLWPPLPHHLQ